LGLHLAVTYRKITVGYSLLPVFPEDEIVDVYDRQSNNSKTAASNINPRVVIGALMVKHLLNTSDRDTIIAIQEKIYIQHFLGFDTIIFEAPFNTSFFVEIRKRMGLENIEKINDLIYSYSVLQLKKASDSYNDNDYDNSYVLNESPEESGSMTAKEMRNDGQNVSTHSGKLLIDATACLQNITYPTDLKLLNASREKTEEIIDNLYNPALHEFTKPRTYREEARQRYF
jgi:hypothetical protein